MCLKSDSSFKLNFAYYSFLSQITKTPPDFSLFLRDSATTIKKIHGQANHKKEHTATNVTYKLQRKYVNGNRYDHQLAGYDPI